MRLIDADAFIDKLSPVPMVQDAIRTAIDTIPTIEERKTGKWILVPYNSKNDLWIHNCSECLQPIMVGGKNKKFKFCPNCGARMESC